MKSLLFDLSATDPPTFVFIAALMLGVAFLACYLPARRATKFDPLKALRHDDTQWSIKLKLRASAFGSG